jgi:predicted phosphoribosyltransferase
MRFHDRVDAGRQLADRLTEYIDRDNVLVLALPRGGVPVAAEIALRLHVPLDVWIVRKLGVPGSPELAMGAIAGGGVQILNDAVIDSLDIDTRIVDEVAAAERIELERRARAFRGDQPDPDVRDREIILVDDGLATGATMAAAIESVRQLGPRRVVVAVPVGARETCVRLRAHVDAVVCVYAPEMFRAVGEFYDDFTQTTDDEVRRALRPE